MDVERQKDFVRLWDGASSRCKWRKSAPNGWGKGKTRGVMSSCCRNAGPSSTNSPKTGRERRKKPSAQNSRVPSSGNKDLPPSLVQKRVPPSAGLTGKRNLIPSLPEKRTLSYAGLDGQRNLSPSLQVPQKRVPSAGLTGKGNLPPSLPDRSHSSLGFRETSTACLQGFDLQGYIRKNGSTNDIRIGINGACSSDFERYLDECAVRCEGGASPCSHNCSMESEEGEDLSLTSSEESILAKTSSPGVDVVPLCWEDQLKIAKVR